MDMVTGQVYKKIEVIGGWESMRNLRMINLGVT